MKIYRTRAPNQPDRFAASQAAAGKDRKHFNSELKIPRAEVATTEIEFASGKTGVIELLNKLARGEV